MGVVLRWQGWHGCWLVLLGWYLSWYLDGGYDILEGNDAGLYTSSDTTLCRGFTCLPKVLLLCHTCVAELVLSRGIIAV